MKKILNGLLALTGLCSLFAAEKGFFNVRDFGAKGDGKSADSVAIQKAIDAAGKIHGTVFFPPGIYLCHDLRIPSHVCLSADPVWGYGRKAYGAVLMLDSPDASAVLDITDSFGVRLRGLTLSGIRYRQGKEIHGIYLNNAEKFSRQENIITIEDCKVMNFSGDGVFLKRVWLFIIRHSEFFGNGGNGVRVFGWDGFVTDNQFSNNDKNGFASESCCSTVMFTANRVEWNKQCGLDIVCGDDWNITGNAFDRNWNAGIALEKLNTVTITGNTFRRCGKANSADSTHLMLKNCQGVTVTGNAFLAGRDDGGKGIYTPRAGMILEKLTDSVITGNVLSRGYTEVPVIDRGGHGAGFVLKDNPGSPFPVNTQK